FKPATELPPAVQELSEQQVADIANMLDTASLYMTIGQLASPPGDSALDLYNRVNEIDPFNITAIDGKTSIAKEYEKLAREAFREGDIETAKAYTETGLLALPTLESLKTFKLENL
ncbi:MAG: hypothetical protein OEX19_01015, partial [Gammaproteobacteria bacterium]|nr:hypothetical protein [Gammaproteobacteria bacterium]